MENMSIRLSYARQHLVEARAYPSSKTLEQLWREVYLLNAFRCVEICHQAIKRRTSVPMSLNWVHAGRRLVRATRQARNFGTALWQWPPLNSHTRSRRALRPATLVTSSESMKTLLMIALKFPSTKQYPWRFFRRLISCSRLNNFRRSAPNRRSNFSSKRRIPKSFSSLTLMRLWFIQCAMKKNLSSFRSSHSNTENKSQTFTLRWRTLRAIMVPSSSPCI